MNNYLLSEAIGDIAGSAYEFDPNKEYNQIQVFHPRSNYTDDTVCTFACAEALLNGTDMAENLYRRCHQHPYAGYGGRFRRWLYDSAPDGRAALDRLRRGESPEGVAPSYGSFGNGSAMRCSAAGWLAQSEEECIRLATATAMPTHDHPEGIKGAVATALAIFYLKNGKDKAYIQEHVLRRYYPDWADRSYTQIHPGYDFDETCQRTVPAALICFLASNDYVDCLRLAIALGGDADTLAAIAGPMAYAHYGTMPDELVRQALELLPSWMVELNNRFDARMQEIHANIQ